MYFDHIKLPIVFLNITKIIPKGGQVSTRDGETAKLADRGPDDKQGRAREGPAHGAGIQGTQLALRPEPEKVMRAGWDGFVVLLSCLVGGRQRKH